MTESKWCRCELPGFPADYSPQISSPLATCVCRFCKKLWRQWNWIKGTHLSNYPIGTVFFLKSKMEYIKLYRKSDQDYSLLLEYALEPGNYYPVKLEHYAYYMLQDNFEIVEDCDVSIM